MTRQISVTQHRMAVTWPDEGFRAALAFGEFVRRAQMTREACALEDYANRLVYDSFIFGSAPRVP